MAGATTPRITRTMLIGLRLMRATEDQHGKHCRRPASVAKVTVTNLILHHLLIATHSDYQEPVYYITEAGYAALQPKD